MSLKYDRVKGAGFEVELVDYLRGKFPDHASDIHRSRLSGRNDQGDIHAKLPVCGRMRYIIIEAKHRKDFALSEFIKEITVEVENWTKAVKSSGKAHGIVIIKRRNQPIGKAYVVQTLDSLLDLIA